MALTFDPRKDASNRRKHGVGLGRVADMNDVVVTPAKTVDAEPRVKFLGEIDGRVYAAVVTYRGEDVRVISLRPASRAERRTYDEAD